MSTGSSATGFGRVLCTIVTVLLALAIGFGAPAANALASGADSAQEMQQDATETHHKAATHHRAATEAGLKDTPCNVQSPKRVPGCPMKSGCLRDAACAMFCAPVAVQVSDIQGGCTARALPAEFPRYAINSPGRRTEPAFRPPIL